MIKKVSRATFINFKIVFAAILLIWSFEISSAQNSEKPLFVIQLTDPQFGMFEKNKSFEKESILYKKAIVDVNRLQPDFVVITGDFVHDQNSENQIDEFRSITSKIKPDIPVYLIPGNHDIGRVPTKRSLRQYQKNYGADRFSFMHKNSFFIGINSGLIKADLPKAEKKQFKWLKRQLKKARNADQIVVFCHYPFFNRSVDEPEAYSNIGPAAREKYLTLFEEYGVDAVFAGHYHNNALNSFNGVELVTTSAVGKPLGEAPSGFRIIKIEDDNVSHEYFGLEKVPEKLWVN